MTMTKRMKDELREMALSLLGSGEKTRLTARDLKLLGLEITVPEITAEAITEIRENLGTSQDVFAQILGVNKMTISKWERGLVTPSGTASVLLTTIQHDPGSIRYRLKPAAAASKSRSKKLVIA